MDSSGNVYVTYMFNHRIQKFTPDGHFISKWGSDRNSMDADPDKIFVGEQEEGSRFGEGYHAVYDIDNDGYDDIILGAYSGGGGIGRTYIYYGNTKELMDTSHDLLFIGAYYYGQLTGRLYVYWGNELSGTDPKPGRILTGEHPNDGFGYGLACGDVNNDGFDDLVIGAYGYKAGTYQGRAYLYYGGPQKK